MQAALILIDFQAGFLQRPADQPVVEPSASHVIDRAKALLDTCRAAGVPIVHVRTAVPTGTQLARLKSGTGDKPTLDSDAYLPPPTLVEHPNETVLHKTGYTGFQAACRDRLESLGVDTVVLAGVYSHACVRQTALDARLAGLQVWIAADAVASDEPMHAAVTRRHLEQRSVRYASVAALEKYLATGEQSWDTAYGKVEAAVATAADFTTDWQASPLATRSDYLVALENTLHANASRVADTVTREIGKPITYASAEVQRTIEMLAAVRSYRGDLVQPTAAGNTVVKHRPLGTVAVVTPFNNPVYLPLGKIAPAIWYGNTVVWKPAPETRATSRLLRDLTQEAGWPAQLLTLVEGDATTGQVLLDADRIDGITITGSSAAGFAAQAAAAQRRIPLQAELGGNNAAIVWTDADLDGAAAAVVAGAFELAGQRCTANRRVIAEDSIADELLERLVTATRQLHCGTASDPKTRVGPLASATRREVVASAVERACAAPGTACVVPHEANLNLKDDLAFYPPTICCCDDPTQEIVQEECFGPILVVQRARDWKHAIELCNGVRQGLSAAIFTRSPRITERFLEEARAGILRVNQSTADAEVDVAFGGWKASGIGPPEHGPFDRDFFTRPQTISTAISPSDRATSPTTDDGPAPSNG
ncbi:MAG: aldehyde dehydrogenase family protein [Planctomycetota bacterium]